MRYSGEYRELKRTFVWDLLRRINYKPSQARTELRAPCQIDVLIETQDGVMHKGCTQDISVGGAQIILDAALTTPGNARVFLDLGEGKGRREATCFSARLLRAFVDREGRNCYAVAFRKGQTREHLELSRWLAGQLRVQNLDELIPNFSNVQKNESA